MSEATPAPRRFPIGLTIATLIAFAILCGLGSWQLQRRHWKEDVLARLEALKTAPAQPLVQVLTADTKPESLAWTRVSVDCGDVGGQLDLAERAGVERAPGHGEVAVGEQVAQVAVQREVHDERHRGRGGGASQHHHVRVPQPGHLGVGSEMGV